MIELNREQQIELLNYARSIIAKRLGIKREIPVSKFADDIFNKKCGAFVTLHKLGNLRGCIGYISGVKNIPDTIEDMSISAAFKDPRFPKLTKEEFDKIDIEISVLSPIEKVDDIEDIVVGRDGLIISNGFNSGLLLPQVATEQGWDRVEFLENTCYKAGLPRDSWKDGSCKLEKFSAQVFGEKSLHIK